MRASFRQGSPAETQADTLCFGLFEGDDAPADLDQALGGRLARLIETGEAKGSFKKVAVLHPDGESAPARAIAVGLGKRAEFTPERARVAGAVGLARARDAG
ncbi:MAG: M17 family peptidase N-terminal domain-containing protein, partial [Solirubrobacterales bacterium]